METPGPALNRFFAEMQAKALKQAELAVGNREDALDIVQEAMIRLASRYSGKQQEWTMLFHRILQNLIRDWYRRKKAKKILLWLDLFGGDNEDEPQDANGLSPEKYSESEQARARINAALNKLPYRQQQVFLLRSWWGHDVSETAYIMRCSEGSVKTHYFRASVKLKQLLEEVSL